MGEKERQENEMQSQEAQPQPLEETGAPQPDDIGRKLAEAEKQIEYYKDLFLRKAADFENFRKRTESDASAAIKYTRADVISDLLPIVDDFERSMKLGKDRRESEAFQKGIELIYQKLQKFLETQGVRPLESLGKEFDVQFHDALLQIPRNDVPPHTVIEEVEKGYILDDRILRHAKVIVSTAPPDDGSPQSASATQPLVRKPDASKAEQD